MSTRKKARKPAARPARAAAKKAWTFLVYMAGDNDLDANAMQDVREMKKVGTTDDLNIVIQLDRGGAKIPTQRYRLRRGTTLAADSLKKLGESNTGSPAALIDFVRWAAAEYPAERTALVLWNHGQGWDDTDLYADVRLRSLQRAAARRLSHTFFRTTARKAAHPTGSVGGARAILLDDDAKDFLDNGEMKQVLTATRRALGHKLELFGMDACLMSMAEVHYQVRDSVKWAVGSEQTEPLEGWPYTRILSALAARPSMPTRTLTELIVDRYVASYAASDIVTQSACDLSGIGPLAGAVKRLASELTVAVATPAGLRSVLLARARTQAYDVPENVDLVDLCEKLTEELGADSGAGRAAHDVAAAVTGGLVTHSKWKGAEVRRSNGLAIYFPTRLVSPLYARLDFTRVTGWGRFLAAFLSATHPR